MNTEFDLIDLGTPANWPRALAAIASSRKDIFLLSGNIPDPSTVGQRLHDIAHSDATIGIVAATAIKTTPVFGVSYQRIFSCSRNCLTPLGLTAERINHHAGEVPTASDSPEFVEASSIWGGAVYIKRALLDRTTGFDPHYDLTNSPLAAPNILFDDLCLQARAVRYRVVCARHIFVDIDNTPTDYPNQLTPDYSRWQEKWGWDPFLPNVNHLRQRWQGTEFGKPMSDDLLDTWADSASEPEVDLVMLAGHSLTKLQTCLESLAKTDYPALRFHLLQNGSSEPVRDYLSTLVATSRYPFPIEILSTPVNIGVCAGLNWLLTRCTAPVIVRMDDDIELPPDWLRQMVGTLRRFPYAGAVLPAYTMPHEGQSLLARPGRLFPRFCDTEPADKMPPYPYQSLYRTNFLAGAVVAYRRKAIDRAGPYDVRFSPSQNEDMDHGMALRQAGYDLLVNGHVMAIHHTDAPKGVHAATIASSLAQRQFLLMKWGRTPAILELALDRDGRVVED